jgi:putative ABC transport system permease protein
MTWLRKLRALVRRERIDEEMRREMHAHLEMQAARHRAAGLTDAEAHFAAQREFGNVASIQEQAREVRRWLWLEQAGQDVAYSARQLLRLPGFTATIVVTLALGIGACTVVFTAINATLLNPLAGQAIEGAVIIHETEPPRRPQMQLSPGMFADVAEQSKSFELVTAWASQMLTIQTDTEPVFVRGAAMTPGLAGNWSPAPALGRLFTAEEEKRGDRVILLSHSLWQRSFRGSPEVLNRVIDTDDGPYTVVGVISPDFAKYGSDLEFWTPLVLSTQQRTQQRGAHFLQTNAKLKPGITLAQAQAELDVIAANIARQYPDTNKGVGLLVRDMGAYINRSLAPMLYLLLAVVSCVLLIACSNVANLLLARATSRQREMAVRMALGAGRGRLVRQLLVESMMLAAVGGVGGILLGKWAIRFLQTYGPSAGTDLARLAFLELEPRVIVFTVGFSLLTGVAFGLAPAWLGSGVNHQDALKQGGHGSTDGKVRAGLRTTLVVVEIALALALLAGAGLLVRSFAKLAEVDPGFAVEQVATMRMMTSPRKYTPATRRQFVERYLERVQALPGVEAAALANMTPFNNPPTMNLEFPGRAPTPQTPIAVSYFVTPDYLQAMGIRLLRGRGFARTDLDTPALALVVSETFVKQYFPDEDPIGRTVALGFGPNNKPTGEIVGVVGDVMQGTLGQPVPPQLYVPRLAGGDFHVVARIKGDPESVLPLLKSEVHALDMAQPVIGARTMAEAMQTALARSRLMLSLLAVFSGVAFVLSAVGIYSVMAYAVGRRTTEFGIRLALGASRGRILADVLRRGLVVVALGLAVGTALALALGEALRATLYGISPRDPVTLAASILLLFAAAFLACLLPARRATKVDPMIALRAE